MVSPHNIFIMSLIIRSDLELEFEINANFKLTRILWMHCSHSQLTVFSWSSLRGQGVGLLSLRHPFGWYDLMHSGLFIGSEDSTNSHDLVLLTFDGRRSLTQHSHHLTSLRGCWARLGQRCHVRLGMARIKNQKPQIPAFTTRRTGNRSLYTWRKMSKPYLFVRVKPLEYVFRNLLKIWLFTKIFCF